jgi:DNA polymerase III epsilon subunit-like protein
MNLRELFPARLSATSEMTDVIVDCETTGTDPYHNGMIQLAAIKFNYDTEEIGGVFNRSLVLPPNRYWSESTRQWWGQQRPGLLQEIMAKEEDAQDVIRAYHQFIGAEGQPLRFWSRGSFDFWFVQSYMDQFGLPMPHQFWKARDTRSFLAALHGTADEPDLSWVTAPGDAHNALRDNVVELKRLFNAKHGVFYEILPPEENAA